MTRQRLNLDEYLQRATTALRRMDWRRIEWLVDALWDAYVEARFIFVCGNGGSGANASHFAEDLGKCTLLPQEFDDDRAARFRIVSLTDNAAYLLAWANDEGFERVFVEQLKNLAGPGDVLLALSGSGNSENVLRAVEWGKSHGLKTWGFTGFTGGRLRFAADEEIHVPSHDMGTVESAHLLLFHWVIEELFHRIHGTAGTAAPTSVGV